MMRRSSYKLLFARKGFVPFVIAEFLGAFNDNVLKIVVSLLGIAAYSKTGNSAQSSMPVALTGGIFILPFILFSGYAGYFADRFSKSKVLIFTKAIEMVTMGLAILILPTSNFPLGLILLFMLASQSAFFSPAKYGLMPEVFGGKMLSRANGIIEMSTFIAIISGVYVGTVLYDQSSEKLFVIASLLLFVSVIGWLAILRIPKVPPSGQEEPFALNPLKIIISGFCRIRNDHNLAVTITGIAWFWFLAGLMQLAIIMVGELILHLEPRQTGLMQVSLAIGIAIGSVIAGRLSGDKVELGLVPLGAIGISVGAILFYNFIPTMSMMLVSLLITGLSAGLYIVPLNANLQQRADKQYKGELIATSNFFSMVGVLLASCTLYIMNDLMLIEPQKVIVIFSFVTLFLTSLTVYIMPRKMLRFLIWLVMNLFYRIHTSGLKHIPESGPALIVSNHLSFADGILLGISIDREVCFMIREEFYKIPVFNWILKMSGAIPVPKGRRVLESLTTANQALKDGKIVCLFAEGGISMTGNILGFKRGYEKIVEGTDAPIIPAHLDNLWGSIASYSGGEFFSKFPISIPYPVRVSFGPPMASTTSPFELRQAVLALGATAMLKRDAVKEPLPLRFIKAAKRNLFHPAIADSTGQELNYAQTLIYSTIISQIVKGRCFGEDMVGVLFPASCGGALVNLGVSLAGKTAVNLNFTAGPSAFSSALEQCGIKTIITSRKFVDKIQMEPMNRMVYIEDLMNLITIEQKIFTSIKALMLPSRLLWFFLRSKRIGGGSVATIIFSSGSTGEPKGVMLSHTNINCNILGSLQVIPHTKHDNMLGVLPFFHSFGYMGTLWLPLTSGLCVVYHSNPIDGRAIGKLLEKYKTSIIISTPTFFQTYARSCTPEQFKSIKLAISGAEKLRDAVKDMVKEKLGIEIMQGYGVTETSPVISVSVPDVMNEKWLQPGHKPGKVGAAIPGMLTKIVDPESGEELPVGSSGLLLVKGGSVMQGYFKNPEKTSEVLVDDWYNTGDIANLDEDGFIQIVDRQSRFSKIGGEMVPHINVEDAINSILGSVSCIVVSLPDDAKGEKLVVLYVHDLSPEDITEQLKGKDIPNLWIPKADSYIRLEELPVLGSGKIDLKQAKEIALLKFNQ